MKKPVPPITRGSCLNWLAEMHAEAQRELLGWPECAASGHIHWTYRLRVINETMRRLRERKAKR